ncbi:hypothetical protein ACX64L_11885 [Pseudomonas monsensis]
MLKINDIGECEGNVVEVDEYVPLTVRFGSGRDASPLYWRAGNGKDSLLEVGLSASTGKIISVTVVTIPSVALQYYECQMKSCAFDVGVPLFCVDGWASRESYSNRFLDDFSVGFDLFVDADRACIVFDVQQEIVQLVRNGSVSFGVSSRDELLSIEVSCLDVDKMDLLKSFTSCG